MYRVRLTAQVKYGHFKEYYELSKKLNELSRQRGWTEYRLWVPTVGIGNEMVAEWDYPDLATFQKEGDAFMTDAEAMELNRSFAEHVVQGSVRSELLETMPEEIA
jgi:hypothetical protein